MERLDRRFDRLRLYLKLRHGKLGPVRVVPYRGHGTAREIHLIGRVLEEKRIRLPSAEDPAWRNLRAMIKRFISEEVPGARVLVRSEDWQRVAVADDEGFVRLRAEPEKPLRPDGCWHEVDLEMLWPRAENGGRRTTGRVLVPPESAEFGVISDIDDTIVRTEATNLLRTLRLVLFSNAYTRLPFEGVAAFYRALRGGADGGGENPIFYVSTGPWNLYDLLEDFLRIQDIPEGPMFLKDWGGLKDLLRGMNHRQHKVEVIRDILDTHAGLKFVLIGDSGQQDAETYGQIADEYPDRIQAIYIRDIQDKRRVPEVCDIADRLGSMNIPMLLVDDTVEAAEHAAAHHLINAGALPGIRREKEEDASKGVVSDGQEMLQHLRENR